MGETVCIGSLIVTVSLYRNCTGVRFVAWPSGLIMQAAFGVRGGRQSQRERRGIPFSRETPKCPALTCISRRKCGPRER